MAGYDDDLRLAHVLADAVERTSLDLFGSLEAEVQVGDDGLLTTPAATRLEELLRHQLHRTRPRDRVEGRTMDATGHGARRWVIDPIDGTANYVRGVPVWATLISLVVEDVPVLGLVAAPMLARRWWAGVGSGAWTGRTLARARRIAVSPTSVLAHASLSADDVAGWMHGPHGPGFSALTDRVWRTRAYGEFWSHALVAEGALDVSLSAWADPLQLATLAPLLREAGGTVTDPSGEPAAQPLTAQSPGQAVISSNGRFHAEILSTLAGAEEAQG
ncbi:inositol monophosphatase family protein [Serinicoccus kebangsaanensis]|uniref:inositol monophosphatase family protein n=1 Tax=Serinicoccus kebangsaanensis TaxID=2602069 RepID=UPI00124D0120|nr:inositol monophosphatase family protein [Serinicoccus kebangsaanensis]